MDKRKHRTRAPHDGHCFAATHRPSINAYWTRRPAARCQACVGGCFFLLACIAEFTSRIKGVNGLENFTRFTCHDFSPTDSCMCPDRCYFIHVRELGVMPTEGSEREKQSFPDRRVSTRTGPARVSAGGAMMSSQPFVNFVDRDPMRRPHVARRSRIECSGGSVSRRARRCRAHLGKGESMTGQCHESRVSPGGRPWAGSRGQGTAPPRAAARTAAPPAGGGEPASCRDVAMPGAPSSKTQGFTLSPNVICFMPPERWPMVH